MEPVIDDDVRAFIDTVAGATRRRDAERLLELFGRVTGQPARMWGPSIVGYGQYHYRYASRREGDACTAGFSPRKASTSIYLPGGVGAHAGQLERLGEHRAAVGCLYITNLDKVDLAVLESIIKLSYRTVTAGTFGHRAADSSGS